MKMDKQASTRSSLERYRKDISRCVRCGSCRSVCPSFMPGRLESMSARGRMALIQAVLDNRLAVSDLYQDRLATCTGCMACEAVCASNVPVTGIIQAAKEAAMREFGLGLVKRVVSAALSSDAAMRGLAWLAPVVLHFAGESVKGKGRRLRISDFGLRNEKAKGTKGKIAFFPGCAIRHFQHDIGRSVVAVLERMGYEVVIPEGLKCCGRPLLSLGDRNAAEELAAHNTALLEAIQADAVITACATCGLTFKKEYPKLLAPSGKGPVPVQDIHEFLAGKMSGLDLTPGKMLVTFHDPCHLSRGQGLSETARDVLRVIPGVTLIEMKNADRCCGFGGVMRITHRGLSDNIADFKALDIINAGASVVATGCPGCRMQIADALRRKGSAIEVMHTVQILEAALLIADFPDHVGTGSMRNAE